MYRKVVNFLISNTYSILVTIAVIVMGYHLFFKSSKTEVKYIDDTITHTTAKNGQAIQEKQYHTSEKPTQVGFSEKFVKDTLRGILGVKENEIKQIHKLKTNIKDTAKIAKSETNEKNQVVKTFEKKDSNSGEFTRIQVTNDSIATVDMNLNLISVVKEDKKGSKYIFYDPSGRATINGATTFEKEVKNKKPIFTWSIQAGTGVVLPNFDKSKATFGAYLGVGGSLNF